jgi:hypothetical protein
MDGDTAIVAIREGNTAAATRTLAVTHCAVLGVLQRRTQAKIPGAQVLAHSFERGNQRFQMA